jgi:hypothetical protein
VLLSPNHALQQQRLIKDFERIHLACNDPYPDAKLSVQNQSSFDDDTEPRARLTIPNSHVDTIMASQTSLSKKEITEVPKSLKRISDIKPLELEGTLELDPKSD